MSIELLPPRLANQIAAGEVVERPASVVKELVENAIDAGATRIDVDIERGGHRLIRIRDNGSGIAKEDLKLALCRHATSKIHDFEDLEAIATLGFRGEALASISAVSRLTLTSRTADQTAAWQAFAEGMDMAVTIEPAAHPVGTTVEVADIFFNTPARRKFLRSEKTELTHIEQLLKRLALANCGIQLQLTHNGKKLRRYPAGESGTRQHKRLAAVCGDRFAEHMLAFNSEFEAFKLSGWLLPEADEQAPANQYFYVNGRAVRDKLLNHAVRQASADFLADPAQAGYVLYLELPTTQVDVNVHPAKQEVRFHQARLVHDFVVKALSEAVAQQADVPFNVDPETGEVLTEAPEQSAQQVSEPASESYEMAEPSSTPPAAQTTMLFPEHNEAAQGPSHTRQPHYGKALTGSRPSASASQAYQTLMSEAASLARPSAPPVAATASHLAPASAAATNNWQWLLRLDPQHQLVWWQQQLWCVDLAAADTDYWQQLNKPWAGQALLMPVALPINDQDAELLKEKAAMLADYGLELALPRPHKLVIRQVPELMKGWDWSAGLTAFSAALACQGEEMIAQWVSLSWRQQATLRAQAVRQQLSYEPPEQEKSWLRAISAEQLQPLLVNH